MKNSPPPAAAFSLLFLALLFPLARAAEPAGSSAPALTPVPEELHFADGRLPVTAAFRVEVRGHDDARLRAGIDRTLRHWAKCTGFEFSDHAAPATEPMLVVECAGAGQPVPKLGDDESYLLDVGLSRAVLRAPTVVGAVRGLATLQQLLQQDAAGFYLPVVSVKDRPRFPWRGVLIDVCRHWQPIEVIKRNLDAMALVKLNVLHLHLTEDQGFRIESRTHPELHEKGSEGMYFTQEQIREIIAYAAERGIRVVPEFDLPAHSTSWQVSHPELASAPGPHVLSRKWGIPDHVLDPTNEALYALLEDFLGEMAALFPDEYLHVGGDENNGVEWSANAKIQAFIREHDLKDNRGLQVYFSRRVLDILRRHHKTPIGWDGIFDPALPAECVVQASDPNGLFKVLASGHHAILSRGYYIDLNYTAAQNYLVDPMPGNTPLSVEQQQRLLGGEATMWTEFVTPEFIDTRIWPRTAAIAERLWSPREVKDVPDMYRRLAVIELRLKEVGIQPTPWPRIEVPGLDPAGPVTAALRTLASIVEPLKEYRRVDIQYDYNQLMPLNDLADWAGFDSRPAREFDAAVLRWLSASGPRDAKVGAKLAAQLEEWGRAGELAAQAPAATRAARGRTEVARSLTAISRVGREAIEALLAGRQLSESWLRSAEAELNHAGLPSTAIVPPAAGATTAADWYAHSGQICTAAVEFPFLPSLWQLVLAATEPAAKP